jgi:hypothetical protein
MIEREACEAQRVATEKKCASLPAVGDAARPLTYYT